MSSKTTAVISQSPTRATNGFPQASREGVGIIRVVDRFPAGSLVRSHHCCCGSVLWSGLLLCPLMLAGCGTNIETIFLQNGVATGRSIVDGLLTDAVNALVATNTGNGNMSPSNNGSVGDAAAAPGSTTDGGSMMNGGGALEDLVGNVETGQTLFMDNGCTACHCADASGGCALNAPSLPGVDVTMIDNKLRGEAFHPIKVDFADQDLADLAAFLDSLAADGG